MNTAPLNAARLADARFAEAAAQHGKGEIAAAEALYRAAIEARPDHHRSLNNLATICSQTGRLVEAVALCEQALAASPDYVPALNTLGIALRRLGRLEEAVARYRQALELEPDHAGALGNLGLALRALGRNEEAVAPLRRAVALLPESASARLNLGNALRDLDRRKEAEAAYREALALDPNYAEAACNLGSVLRDDGRIEEAEALLRRSLALDPTLAETHYNLGNALKDRGEPEAAITCYREAIRLKPDHVAAHWNLSHMLLLLGRLDEGFAEYEWRWRLKEMGAHGFAGPQWDLNAKPGTPVIVHAEQGFGDAIQFVRYVPLLAARGHEVTLRVRPPLLRLFGRMEGVEVVTELKEGGYAGSHCPLMSLPHGFGTRLDSIPAEVPYLGAAPDAVARFKARLEGPGLKLGLAWRGNPAKAGDAVRSLDPALLAPLLQRPGVRVVSLQKEPAPGDLETLRRFGPVEDWTAELGDFADTAALIAALDLVVTVDTAVAHLAGALARPVWVMLPRLPDWRWLLGREDSPWYPTARLFRQATDGDWAGVIGRMVEALPAPAESASSLLSRGIACLGRGELAEAAALIEQALALDPEDATAHNALGALCERLGKREAALACFARAAALRPAIAEYHVNHAIVLRKLGRVGEAVEAYRRAVEVRPDYFEALLSLGDLLRGLGRRDEAAAAFERVLARRPDDVAALLHLGRLRLEAGRLDEAVRLHERAVSLAPGNGEAHQNLCGALLASGRIEEAIAEGRKAVALDPALDIRLFNLSIALLSAGRYAEGWKLYEHRARESHAASRAALAPKWQAGLRPGTSVLVHTEQGLGDVIQFARFLPLLAAHGHRVVLEVREPLRRLMAGLDMVEVVTRGAALPPVQQQIALLSLPHALGIELDKLPAKVPYLKAPPAAASAWRARLDGGGGRRVGLAWRGSAGHRNDFARSIHPTLLKPLFEVPGVRLASLQKEPRAGDLETLRRFGPIEDWTAELGDLADTAALIEALDLVIAVDTAVAHLAGALGKPLWVLLPYAADWRWLSGRDDSPWYPTARLFRQAGPGDWAGAVARAAAALGGMSV
ncbi:MAG: tetratricopeptide repeat protein [Alphaproteobacteria bacterium]